jgi:D-glycero-alpha-D-manno-heptose 1-phosphate guanylyltransferase
MSKINEIDAVVLCGGLGTRIRETIGEKQKVMAEIDNEPFLNIKLYQLKKQGVNRVILCTGYQAQDIESYYRENDQDLVIDFSNEEEPLGTGGAIRNAEEIIDSDPFIAMNGDVFTEVNYKKFLQFHLDNDADATVAVIKVEDSKDYGGVALDEDKRVVRFTEKGEDNPGGLINAGIYCFNRDVFDLYPETTKVSLEYDIFPQLCGKEFFGFEIKGKFLDIGTPDRFKLAKEIVKRD